MTTQWLELRTRLRTQLALACKVTNLQARRDLAEQIEQMARELADAFGKLRIKHER